jgi:DNA anti-recombination protein RmuC
VTAMFADGREPSENERHLLNLLSWREREAREAKADNARLRSEWNGLRKANLLLNQGMESQSGQLHDLKQQSRSLEADNAALRRQISGHCERIAAASEVIASFAEVQSYEAWLEAKGRARAWLEQSP